MSKVSKFKKGVFWSIGGDISYLSIAFLVNVILARILSPEEFGIMAIAYFFIAIAQVLTESGLSGALVRKSNSTEVDNSTIFIFNLLTSLFLYLLLYLFSDVVEAFYEIKSLALYLKVLGLIMIINSFRIIQNVRLIKELDYKSISVYKIISITTASVVAIYFAKKGYGVWALILMQCLNSFINTFILWVTQKGLSVYIFSKESFKELYKFGLFTTLSSLLDTAFDNAYQLVLGKYFSLTHTGLYFQSKKITDVSVSVIRSTNSGVVFAGLSKVHNNPKEFDEMYIKTSRAFTFVVGLVCLLIFIFAKEILFLFYGEKWLNAEFYMQVLAVSCFFYMQESFNRNIFKVFNKTHKIFILELIKKVIMLLSLGLGIYMRNIELLMYGYATCYMLSYLINFKVSREVYKSKFLKKEYQITLKVILASVIIAVLIKYLDTYIQLKDFIKFSYLPIVLILYLLILNMLGVINIKEDLKILYDLKNAKKGVK